jgi:2-oxoglutarate ferredoxin oxidoreductase subunit gamma
VHAEIVIAGSGGQGVLLIGRLLAEASFLEGHEVVWLPSYGAEKRGGTVSCSVTISDAKIGAMFISRPSAAVAMNQAAAIKLEPAMKPGGLLVINQSLVSAGVSRGDICAICLPASHLAMELGNESAANLVALGALVAGCPVVSRSEVVKAMDIMFARNQKALEMNQQAFARGFTIGYRACGESAPVSRETLGVPHRS